MAKALKKILTPLELFLKTEAASGIILLLTTVIALAWANSPWFHSYESLMHWPLGFSWGDFLDLSHMTLHHWINDGLMVIFFFVVGLEIKRELLVGELSSPKKAALPIFAALGGMIAPALIYTYFNFGTEALGGWGIPMATDIAFAVGVLSLMSRKVPFALKVFLLALAIVDDLGAVLVIAFFYTEELFPAALGVAALGLGLIQLMKYAGVQRLVTYFVLSLVVWLAILKSGVHATVAGVILGFMTPMNADNKAQSPLHRHVENLHPWVSFVIMPIFALANAGVRIEGLGINELLHHPVSLGVMLGLFLGKPIGILSTCWLTEKLGWAHLPRGANWYQIACIGVLAGIGFTMALFVSHLALKVPEAEVYSKLGILLGSLASSVLGLLLLSLARDQKQ